MFGGRRSTPSRWTSVQGNAWIRNGKVEKRASAYVWYPDRVKRKKLDEGVGGGTDEISAKCGWYTCWCGSGGRCLWNLCGRRGVAGCDRLLFLLLANAISASLIDIRFR